MKRVVKRAAALLLPLLLGACAGKAPERHEYLLPMPTPALPSGSQSPVHLLPVTIAPYLDQRGIVLQTEGAEVHVGRQNRWAEPLDASVDRYLQVAIANASGRVVEVAPLTTAAATTELKVRIHQLHGSADGTVRLVAEWSVSSATGTGALHTFDATVGQSTAGYPGLVEAHGSLLDRLAAEIAASLDNG